MARPIARTPEARENQLIAMAVDLAEKQLAEGTASPMIIAHYIKMGSMKERLEREKLQRENEHLRAKTESLQSAQNLEAIYKEAIDAFRDYRGIGHGGD